MSRLGVLCTWIFRRSLGISPHISSGSPAVLTKLVGAKGETWRWQPLCTDEKTSLETTKRAIRNLQDILLVDQPKATRVMKKYPAFKTASVAKISDTIDFLSDRRVGTQRLRNNPWLLLMTPDDIEKNTKAAMSILKVEFPVAVAFSGLSRIVLLKIAAVWKSKSEKIPKVDSGPYAPDPQNRMEYLACRLRCSVEDVADMMGKVNNIALSRIDKVDKILKLLLDAGVPTDAIISDPWTFDNQLGRMEERLTICRQHGLSPIKPWILRSPMWKFESHVNRTVTEHHLLKGHSDISSFLQQKLECDESSAQEILLRVSSVKTASAAKLNEMIDFLFSKGFTNRHILDTPRVLGHSVSTISRRLEDFNVIGCVPDSLLELCHTSRDHNSLIKRMARDRDIRRESKKVVTSSDHSE